ncbi:MAG: hypothetical protein K2N84_04190 [Clostridia bacterium]|nr:hypothetical protein [Clostridia bacterium]
MRFRNAVRLTIDNFSAVFKLLLYRLMTGVVFFSLIYVILKLALNAVTSSAEWTAMRSLIYDFFHALVTGQTEKLQTFHNDFQEAAKNFIAMLGAHGGSIAGAIVGVSLIYILSRFANGLGVFAIGNVINDRMSVFSRTPFSAAYFKSIGQAALYQVVYVPLTFVYDVIIILLCWVSVAFVPAILPLGNFLSVMFGISLAVTVIVGLQALKMAVFSAWMPAMIADKLSMSAGLKRCFSTKKDFGRRFAAYLLAVYVIVIVNVLCLFTTVGSALIISIPLSFIFLLSMQFVNYYKQEGRKYFVSLNKIAGETPEDLGNLTE